MKYTTTVADYLTWRGGYSLSVDPFNEVDNLVLCIISYINFRRFPELLTRNPREAVSPARHLPKAHAGGRAAGPVPAELHTRGAAGGADRALCRDADVRL